MGQTIDQMLAEAVGSENVAKNEPMKKHTTFRIGGPADFFVQPRTAEETAEVIRICKNSETPWHIIGNGSNLLVGDKGVRGVVIRLFRNFGRIEVKDAYVTAQAGALNAQVARRALEEGLSGFAFAAGIPGTVGGALVMNAGAYGGEIKDILKEASVLTEDGAVRTLTGKELGLSYRSSVIPQKGYVVLSATFGLKRGERREIEAEMEELREKRVSKQPLEYPSAGSTFKRPEGHFAGKLIMDAGLSGFCVGGARISEKHCGFVINAGGATAEDVRGLIKETQRIVNEKFGVQLEPEIKFLGEF